MKLLALLCLLGASSLAAPLNILLFTADAMNFDSSGVYGGPSKDLTPHIDQLAAQGLHYERAYTTVAVYQPARQTMFTGRYPHRTGSMGFFPLQTEVRTLQQQLHDAGYLISAFGKNPHHQPAEKFHAQTADDQISPHSMKLAVATRRCYLPCAPPVAPHAAGPLGARPEPAGHAAADKPRPSSLRAGEYFKVTFLNSRPTPAEVIWVPVDGSRTTSATLTQNDTYRLRTRPGAVGVIRDEKQRMLGHCVVAISPDQTAKAIIPKS